MQATFEHIEPNREQSSFKAYRRETDYFDFHWHYHPELELTFIEKGNGIRVVGDHTATFSDGDLVLLGHNLPHTWVSESKGEVQSAIVIQFRSDLIAASQLDFPEFRAIKSLLSQSHLGLSFSKKAAEVLYPNLCQILESQGIKKLTTLWETLNKLGQTGDFKSLASPVYRPSLGIETENRVDKACQHIHTHFTRKISLPEISGIVGMTETSFCRFFKKMTGKSFTAYVNELRISRARKLLTETDASVSEVAYKSGFESMTHFNRIFLKTNGKSPRAYRKMVKGMAK